MRKQTRLAQLGVAVLLITGLMACSSGKDGTPQAARDITMEDATSMTYAGIYETPVALKGGLYEGEPFVEDGASRPRVQLIKDLFIIGELDDSPGADAAVLLTENSGGSGTFLYLAIMTVRDGQPVNSGTVRIGDRIDVVSLALQDKEVVLRVIEQGPKDPAGSPTQLAAYRVAVDDDGAEISGHEITGTLSLDMIAGKEWRLVDPGGGRTWPGDLMITFRIDSNRVSGLAGCNRYSGTIDDPDLPGGISLSNIVTTRKICDDAVMAAETQFLNNLKAVQMYSFYNGHLELAFANDTIRGAMLFDESAQIQ